MKIINTEQNSDEWFDLRKGKITGSKLKGLIVKRGTAKKIGFYELLAERIAEEKTDENPMARGSRLEDEAIEKLEQEFGVIERVGFCVSDENENIAISMDGYQAKEKRAFEVKCLSSAKHLQAYFEQKIPSEYEDQALQYFIVDEKLETLIFAFYDPRIPSMELHTIKLQRADIEENIVKFKEYQLGVLKEIDEMAEQLTF